MESKKTKYNNRIITWSKILTLLFIIVVAVCDLTTTISAKYISLCYVGRSDSLAIWTLAGAIWAGTIAGYVVLISLYKLLSNMSKDIVFDKKNTKLMKVIFYALVGAGVAAAVGALIWFEALVFTGIALFIALIVLSVKICFEKAIEMKDELDLTI